jgi:hypothetical protein
MRVNPKRNKARAEIVDRADQRAANVMRQIQRTGATSLRQIAEALNARGIRCPARRTVARDLGSQRDGACLA